MKIKRASGFYFVIVNENNCKTNSVKIKLIINNRQDVQRNKKININ